MGVMENPRSQHLSAGTEDFKFVGEMIPASVGVGDGDRKVIPVTLDVALAFTTEASPAVAMAGQAI